MNKGAERDFAAVNEAFDAAEDDLDNYVQRSPFYFLKPGWLAIGAAGAVLGLGARWAVMNDWLANDRVANDSLVGASALLEPPRVKVQPLLPVEPGQAQISQAASRVRSELPAAVAEPGIAPARPPVERALQAASLLPAQNVVVVPPVFMGTIAPVAAQRRTVALSRPQGKAVSLESSADSTDGRGLMLPPVSESSRNARTEPSPRRGLLVPPSVQERGVSAGSNSDAQRPDSGDGRPQLKLELGSPATPGVSQK